MKNLIEYLKEALLFGRQLSDELWKEVDKMKLTQNWNGDCFAVISHKPVDLDALDLLLLLPPISSAIL